MNTELTPEGVADLCKDLQRQYFPEWNVNSNSIWHTDRSGRCELTVLLTERRTFRVTFKTWANHYMQYLPAFRTDRTVFEFETKTWAELLRKVDIQIKQNGISEGI
jgi:hypothetical protein